MKKLFILVLTGLFLMSCQSQDQRLKARKIAKKLALKTQESFRQIAKSTIHTESEFRNGAQQNILELEQVSKVQKNDIIINLMKDLELGITIIQEHAEIGDIHSAEIIKLLRKSKVSQKTLNQALLIKEKSLQIFNEVEIIQKDAQKASSLIAKAYSKRAHAEHSAFENSNLENSMMDASSKKLDGLEFKSIYAQVMEEIKKDFIKINFIVDEILDSLKNISKDAEEASQMPIIKILISTKG